MLRDEDFAEFDLVRTLATVANLATVLQIGDAVITLADEHPEMQFVGPKKIGGTPVTLALYVEAVDEVFERALRSGAKSVQPVADQFYGDRSGQFEDPFGHRWSVATRVHLWLAAVSLGSFAAFRRAHTGSPDGYQSS